MSSLYRESTDSLIDTCLPFGLPSAPYLFNQFAMALHWILQTNYDMPHLIHYLEDYLIMEQPGSPRCALPWVGAALHPTDQTSRILAELDRWSAPRKTTKWKLLSLIGLLSFAAWALPSVPTPPDQPQHQGPAAPPPHSSQFRGYGRHHRVEDLCP